MSKGKDFIRKNRKILMIIAIAIILLLTAGIYLIWQRNVDTENQVDTKNQITTQAKDKNVISNEESGTERQVEEDKEENEEKNKTENQQNQQDTVQAQTETQEENRLPDSIPSQLPDATNSNSNTDSECLVGTDSANNSHTHVWNAHTAQKWVPHIVTVVDQPEQNIKYSIYRMYWYTTGTWEETRDAERFNTWYHSEEGGLYPLYHPYKKPEDNPLFLAYDKNGNPTYINDHVIAGPYYETIPAVTHEEDHGHYETYVDYYYCDCGATK